MGEELVEENMFELIQSYLEMHWWLGARFIFFFKGAGFITFADIQQIPPVISFIQQVLV